MASSSTILAPCACTTPPLPLPLPAMSVPMYVGWCLWERPDHDLPNIFTRALSASPLACLTSPANPGSSCSTIAITAVTAALQLPLLPCFKRYPTLALMHFRHTLHHLPLPPVTATNIKPSENNWKNPLELPDLKNSDPSISNFIISLSLISSDFWET